MADKLNKKQLAVVNGTGNMLVSASAGSGKTKVVVDRVLKLLREGDETHKTVDVRRILLMTFTRAAAKEMREKLLKRMFEEAGCKGSENVTKQIGYIPFAHIETIDGFCVFLMRKFCHITGDDPAVTFGDESKMKRVLDECYDRVIEGLCTEKKEDTQEEKEAKAEFLRVYDYFRVKRKDTQFRESVYDLKSFAEKQENKDDFYQLAESDGKASIEAWLLERRKKDLRGLLAGLDTLLIRCKEEGRTDDAPYAEVRARLAEAQNATKLTDLFPIAEGIAFPQLSRRNDPFKEEIKEAREPVKRWASAVASDAGAYKIVSDASIENAVKRVLVRVAKETADTYEAYKKSRKIADIKDAMDSVVTILGNEQAKKEIAGMFDYVFVDEYQDTDPKQERLVAALDNDDLCLVGDVKQAIYQWRSAEPSIFLDREAEYDAANPKAKGKVYPLNMNYRSVKEVLDFTNHICNVIMTKEFCDVDYSNKDAQLQYGGSKKNYVSLPAVSIYKWEAPPRAPKGQKVGVKGVYSVQDAARSTAESDESEFVAQTILQYKKTVRLEADDEARKKGEVDADGTRPLRYKDIAILTRSSTPFRVLADALMRNGIPFYAPKPLQPSKTEKPVSRERDALVNLLRVCVDASDDVSLYDALKTPVAGFTDKELTLVAATKKKEDRDKPFWDTLISYDGEPKIKEKIKRFIEFADEIRVKSAYSTAEELLNEILGKKFDAHLLGNNESVLAELNAFISYAANKPANASAEAFLTWYDEEYLGNPPSVQEDAVALMTMHGSKGLQFPVVFLPFLHNVGKGDGGKLVLDGKLGMSVDFFDETTGTTGASFGKYVLQLKKKEDANKERARLMYVAFTRAENYLVLSGKFNKSVKSSYEDEASIAGWVQYVAAGDQYVSALVHDMPHYAPAAKKPPSEVEPLEVDLTSLLTVYAHEEDAKTLAKESVSAILEKHKTPGAGKRTFGKGEEKGEESKKEIDPKAAEKGVAIHAVMQYIPYGLTTEEEVIRELDEMVGTERLMQEERDLVDPKIILNTLQSSVIEEAKKYESACEREKAFLLLRSNGEGREPTLVQGVIDLLIDEGEEYVVVDFKTGKADAKTLEKRYREQLELYVEAVRTCLCKTESEKGKKVRAIIYGVETGCRADIPDQR